MDQQQDKKQGRIFAYLNSNKVCSSSPDVLCKLTEVEIDSCGLFSVDDIIGFKSAITTNLSNPQLVVPEEGFRYEFYTLRNKGNSDVVMEIIADFKKLMEKGKNIVILTSIKEKGSFGAADSINILYLKI